MINTSAESLGLISHGLSSEEVFNDSRRTVVSHTSFELVEEGRQGPPVPSEGALRDRDFSQESMLFDSRGPGGSLEVPSAVGSSTLVEFSPSSEVSNNQCGSFTSRK